MGTTDGTGIQLHDTRTGTLTELVPREPGEVHMYTCGPTVYDYTHIGHLRPALVADVLARHLRRRGYRVLWVSNFTDVDDRIIARANGEGITPGALAQRYINDYLENMAALGVRGVDRYARVTEHIPDVVAMVERLLAGGYAYAVDGDVYFAIESKADYGKLSGRTLGEMQAGARVAVDPRKRHPMDFALWKAAKPEEPSWPSPWGPGRPGWHIECSAMSLRYLGDNFDVHGGGDDLIFPHHENEIAQSEAFTGSQPFVRIWLHNAMVQAGREKMSKSLGNFVRLTDLVRLYPAGVLRHFVLSTHYRKPLQYSTSALEEARKAWGRLGLARRAWRAALSPAAPVVRDGAAARIEIVRTEPPTAAVPAADAAGRDLGEVVQRAEQGFSGALDEDLNTAGALGHLFDLVRAGNAALASGAGEALGAALVVLQECGDVLGLWEGEAQDGIALGTTRAAGLVELLIDLRGEARAYRDWAMADRIRRGLADLGVSLEDTPQGTRWTWPEPAAPTGGDGQ